MTRSELLALVGQVRDALDWHRRLVAALLVGVAVVAALSAMTPSHPRTLRVWTAARDLAGGAPLRAADVALRALPAADVPTGTLAAGVRVVGRLLAAPVRRGEPLTDVRLLEPPLLAALNRPGLVAVPVRVADGAAAAALVHPGDVVDVLAATAAPDGAGPDGSGSFTTTVAAAATVLAVPQRDGTGADDAGLIVVAVTRDQAGALAGAGGERLSIVLRRT